LTVGGRGGERVRGYALYAFEFGPSRSGRGGSFARNRETAKNKKASANKPKKARLLKKYGKKMRDGSNQVNPFATAPRGPGSIAPNILA